MSKLCELDMYVGSFDRSKFSGRLREHRMLNGWSQDNAAEWTGLEPCVISRYETGTAMPSAKNLFYLCRGLRVSADWLLGLKEER